jgi:hypothetical protein
LDDNTDIFLCEELLHKPQCVARSFIVMQKPLYLTFVAPVPLKCIAQPLQTYTLSKRDALVVHQAVDFKEFRCLVALPTYILV